MIKDYWAVFVETFCATLEEMHGKPISRVNMHFLLMAIVQAIICVIVLIISGIVYLSTY